MNRVTPFQQPQSPPQGASVLRGAMMMIVGCAALTVNDACMKALVAAHPVGQVVSLRAALGLLLLILITPAIGGLRALTPRDWRSASVLTGLLIVGLFLFPTSLKYMPLADAIMLAYLSPVIVAILSPLVLQEQVGWRRRSAVALGLAGAALVIRPGAGGLQLAALLPIGVAISIAFRDLLTRRFIHGENAYALVAAAHLGAALLGLLSLGTGWSALSAFEWALLLSAAAMITLAQVVMVSAFRYADATVLSCLKYTSIVWAAAFGWMFFQEVPDTLDWVGAGLIALSGVVITLRGRRTTGAA